MEAAESHPSHPFTLLGGAGRATSGVHAKDPDRILSDAEADQVLQWIAAGTPRAEVARRVGVSPGRIFDRSIERRQKGTLAHPSFEFRPRRQGLGGGRPRGPAREAEERGPSPEEIAQRCLEIQRTWSREIEQLRRFGVVGDRPSPLELRRVTIGTL